MSTSNWLTNVGSGVVSGATTGALAGLPEGGIGAIPGALIGGVLGGITGIFGATEADSNDRKQEEAWKESQKDPTTPYKIRLPSGAVVTLYAHGKPKSQRPVGGVSGLPQAALDAAGAYAYMNYKDKKEKEKTNKPAVDADVTGTPTAITAVAPVQTKVPGGFNDEDLYKLA